MDTPINKPLVSIITPCLNGEEYLHRYFDSILSQTYKNLELIFINDGSTDRTEEIALSYRDKLEHAGIKYIYLYQDNAGQASAINKGLAIFSGDYLTWPDSDDWMTPECIEIKVAFLENNPQFGLVLCNTAIVNETDLTNPISVYSRKKTDQHNIFGDLVYGNDIFYAPGGYMCRTTAFLDSLSSRHIYESRGGQNWQMLLPISCKYACGFLNEVLYYYVIRGDSHSHAGSLSSADQRIDRYEDILAHVLRELVTVSVMNEYLARTHRYYQVQRLYNAYYYGSAKEYNRRLFGKNRCYPITKEIVVLTLCKNIPLFNRFYQQYKKRKVHK